MGLWKCPDCGSIKEIICPVCGAEKEAGALCETCGSEYSHTSCPKCYYKESCGPNLDPQSYKSKLGRVLRDRKEIYLTYYELMRLVAVIDSSALDKICVNDPIQIKDASRSAFGLSDLKEAEKLLSRLEGMDKDLAGKILKTLRSLIYENND